MSEQQATDIDAVQRVVDVVDLVADDIDSTPEGVAETALGKIRRRGGPSDD